MNDMPVIEQLLNALAPYFYKEFTEKAYKDFYELQERATKGDRVEQACKEINEKIGTYEDKEKDSADWAYIEGLRDAMALFTEGTQ